MEAKVATRTQEERTAEAKERLHEAALFLFANEGYGAVSLPAISLRAGFSRALAQYHYADKAALALEILDDQVMRDNHIHLINCSDDCRAPEAWSVLQSHLAALEEYYGSLHGTKRRDIHVAGGMAIRTAALTSRDATLSARVEQLSREQVARIERILRLCQTQGFIKPDTDIRGTAVLYVHSVWGLAQALFASPQAAATIKTAFEQLGRMLDSLRVEKSK